MVVCCGSVMNTQCSLRLVLNVNEILIICVPGRVGVRVFEEGEGGNA